jgi:hypothetical protein
MDYLFITRQFYFLREKLFLSWEQSLIKIYFFGAQVLIFVLICEKRIIMIYTLIFILNLFSTKTAEFTRNSRKVESHKETLTKPMSPVDISGYWEGTISRDEGYGKRINFEIEVVFTQKGKEITGISIVRAKSDGKIYNAKMELSGRINGTYLKYAETKTVNFDPIPDAEWCVKKVELIYKNTNQLPTLEGVWEGMTQTKSTKEGDTKLKTENCIPGRVVLKRKPPRV